MATNTGMKASEKSANVDATIEKRSPPSCAVLHTRAAARSSAVRSPLELRARLRSESMPSEKRRINPIGVNVQSFGWPKVSSASRIVSTLHAVANSSLVKS